MERSDDGPHDLDARAADLGFRFVPRDLSDRSRHLIESYHGVHGYARLADLLWHPETREFIVLHHELSPVLRRASIIRSAKRSNQGYVFVAAILLSLEILAKRLRRLGQAPSACEAQS